jgi:hypothetical protein
MWELYSGAAVVAQLQGDRSLANPGSACRGSQMLWPFCYKYPPRSYCANLKLRREIQRSRRFFIWNGLAYYAATGMESIVARY